MRLPTLFLVLLLPVTFVLAADEPSRKPAEPATAQRIEQLIRQLGSENFDQRQQAAKELQAIGPSALDSLRKAAKSDDAEVRRAAEELVGAIQQQAQTTGLLTPRRLRLDLKEVAVAEAVAEFSRKSGYPIALTGDVTALAQRKVTLQTGETSFWDALRQLCARAGVDEAPNRAMPADPNAPPPLVRPLLLQVGQASELPADVAGSVRVRAVKHKDAENQAGTVTTTLELTPEPRLQSFRVNGVPSITTAVDEHGQALRVVLEAKENADKAASTVVVRLEAGAKASTRLRELTGRMRVEAVTSTEPAVTVEKVLAAAGQSHKGTDGPTLHVHSVAKAENGTVKLAVGVENAQGGGGLGGGLQIAGGNVVIRGGAIVIRGGGNVRINAGGIVIDGSSPGSNNFPRLFDAKGQEYQLAEVLDRSFMLQRGRVTHEATLVFRPTDAKSEPGRLVLYGQKTVAFDVPFTLKNVPVQ